MGLAFAAVAGAATAGGAESGGPGRMSAAEVRGFMLGKKMSGVREDTGEAWFECVAAEGDTLYDIAGRQSAGFVEVGEDGRTCFTYPDADTTSRACFTVERGAGGPVFVEQRTALRWRVTRTDSDFAGCPAGVPMS